MTTDTPRTDAFRASIEADLHAEWDECTSSAWAGFAGSLERERDVLARWKKEALVHMRKWDAVDEAVREHPDTLVGHNITDTALRFIRERDEAIGVSNKQAEMLASQATRNAELQQQLEAMRATMIAIEAYQSGLTSDNEAMREAIGVAHAALENADSSTYHVEGDACLTKTAIKQRKEALAKLQPFLKP